MDSDSELGSPRSPEFGGSDSPITSPSPFSRVPTEIKALIAAQAARQDEAYKQRVSEAFEGSHRDVVQGGARSWDGLSVNALFLVDREWSALAAAHVFKHITSKRCGDTLFTFSIAPRFGSFVFEAAFDPISGYQHAPGGHETLLHSLQVFTHLEHVSMSSSAFDSLFDIGTTATHRHHRIYGRHDPSPTVQQLLYRSAFLEVLSRLKKLSLVAFNPPQLAWLLPRLGSTIGHLEITLLDDREHDERDPEELKEAHRALSQLKGSEHLSVGGVSIEFLPLIDDDDDADTEWALDSLKSLQVVCPRYHTLSAGSWRFIESLMALEELDLDLNTAPLTEALERRAEGGTKSSFPALKHIRLQASEELTEQVLSLFTLAAVHSLALVISDYKEAQSEIPLLPLLQHSLSLFSGCLKKVELRVATPLTPDASASPATLPDLFALASEHEMALTVGPRYDPFHHPLKTSDPTSLTTARAAADEALQFGLARSAGLQEAGDFRGMRTLLDLLVPLRGTMLREKD